VGDTVGHVVQLVDARPPVPVGNARLKSCGLFASRAGYSCGLALLIFLFGSKALQNAVAEGETRTITMHHLHTDEDITITYKRNGIYDEGALEKLNWFLRDWRRSEEIRMDPHLIDLVWEVQRETGSKDPIQVVCGYRSPKTNAMLRRRSNGVARFSQHMLGHAMDFYIAGVPLEHLRIIGLRLQRGGVGFYPESGSPFVHMDTGNIRMWPRMSREELSRVFPDGRTVHLPSDGRPLSGYALALADIRKRGSTPSSSSLVAARDAGISVGTVVASNEHVNPFARLFGLKSDDEGDEDAGQATAPTASTPATRTAASDQAPRAKPKPALLAALERKAREKIEAAAPATAAAAAAAAPKLIRTAALVPPTRPAPQAAAAPRPAQPDSGVTALTPNQVIAVRGFWGETAAQSANPLTAIGGPRGSEVASAAAAPTGSVGPRSGAGDDRVPPELALAYAEQPDRGTSSPSPGIIPVRYSTTGTPADQVRAQPAPYGTTIAVKRTTNQVISTVLSAPARVASIAAPGTHFDNPWIRAVVLSPSVRKFLTTLSLSVQDFRSLASLMHKPASSVVMTFSADPNLGLSHDHFSGSAVVFVSTVTYPTHTASLH
jgi:uncharacterized protein YcbK (DUF882 family)